MLSEDEQERRQEVPGHGQWTDQEVSPCDFRRSRVFEKSLDSDSFVILSRYIVFCYSVCTTNKNVINITLIRGKAGKRHNTGHKGRARVNRLAQGAPITEKSIETRMRRLIAA